MADDRAFDEGTDADAVMTRDQDEADGPPHADPEGEDDPDVYADAEADADGDSAPDDDPKALLDEYDDGYDVEETEFATVATGATVDDAKRTALEQLRKIVPWVTVTDVEYEVVDEGSRGGLFGRGRVQAQVEARVCPRESSEEPLESADTPMASDLTSFLAEVIELMGLEADVQVHDDGDSIVADLGGPDLGILIGRHGQTIDALQYVAAIAVNRRHKSRRRVIVDAEGYRDRRAASLHSMADRVAQRVIREHQPVTLKPMTAAERKVIHLHLKDHPRVETISEGQEPNRAVTIALRPQS